MGLRERFARIWGAVSERFWNLFDRFWGLREGHLDFWLIVSILGRFLVNFLLIFMILVDFGFIFC